MADDIMRFVIISGILRIYIWGTGERHSIPNYCIRDENDLEMNIFIVILAVYCIYIAFMQEPKPIISINSRVVGKIYQFRAPVLFFFRKCKNKWVGVQC